MKIVVAGKAIVITSSAKLADLEKIKKYRKDALTLYGGEEGKEPIFTICLSNKGDGSLSNMGAAFANENADGYAQMTLVADMGEKPEEYIADNYGAALTNLEKLEATLEGVLKQIDEERAQIMGKISKA